MLKLFTLLCLTSFNVAHVEATEIDSISSQTVRLAVVNTPAYSGLIEFLANDFKQQSGLDLEITNSSDVFTIARSGKADIIIAHYGKTNLKQFVLDSYGEWPAMVFSNQAALIGPKTDPAKASGSQNIAEGLSKIAKSKSTFIASSKPGLGYLTDMVWHLAGLPDKTDWFITSDEPAAKLVKLAEQKQGYFIWGAIPFLRYKENHDSPLEIILSHDAILQRVMCSIVVNPNTFSGINYQGAQQLQAYLLRPETQAKIAAFRTSGANEQLWWPAGRNN